MQTHRILRNQRAEGRQDGRHLVELEPRVQLRLVAQRRLAEVAHHVLPGGAAFQQECAAQACMEYFKLTL